jgi:hypothetical protein
VNQAPVIEMYELMLAPTLYIPDARTMQGAHDASRGPSAQRRMKKTHRVDRSSANCRAQRPCGPLDFRQLGHEVNFSRAVG